MRRVYYIIAPTCSGKTTSATRLAKELSLPLYHADTIYDMLANSFPVNCLPEKLTRFELWDDPSHFGLFSWGDYSDMAAAKCAKYIELLQREPGDFVIEGFTLSFESERAMVTQAVGAHKAILIRIDLEYEDWVRLFVKRNGEDRIPSLASFDRLRKCFEVGPDEKFYVVSHPSQIGAKMFEEAKTPQTLTQRHIMRTLTEEEFFKKAEEHINNKHLDRNGNEVGYWKDAADRWSYYSKIADIIRQHGRPEASVLELGCMGMPVVLDADLMDYDRHLSYYSEGKPDLIHDARCIPWPVPCKKYDWFIALRVFHHLWPVQRECFEEAKRVARNVVLVIPEKLPPDGGTVVLPEQLRTWNDNVRPDILEPAGRFGYIYVWLEK